jgi:hypothetical protein
MLAPIAHAQTDPPPRVKPDIRQLLQSLTESSPDPCGPGPANERDWQPSRIEMPLFEAASDLVVAALNTDSAPPVERARKALETVERTSTEINGSWPREDRFRFELLDLNEILVAKMSVRVYGRFFVFGPSTDNAGKPNGQWRRIYLLEDDSELDAPWVEVQLYSLHRGPSGRARFLARSKEGGCAGSFGVMYDARAWNPEYGGSVDRIIDLKGALGLDDEVKGFPQIGKLRTDGAIIDLPYCWWSAIDTWDNPSMCAVDRYDLSGDTVRFVSRPVNRPDLLPVAKAAEYAAKHDFAAVRGYCTSDAVARRLVGWMPDRLFDVEIKVKRLGPGRELLYDEGGNYRFTVEKQGERWLVDAFSAN